MGKKVLKDEKQTTRRGKPRRAYVASLTKMTPAHYAQLERACVQAYLTRNYRVTLALSYLTILPDDFPRPLVARKELEGLVDQATFSARAMLQWLNKHGHSTITAESIRQSLVDFTIKTKGILDDLDS